jgi:hypothetical protein
MRVCQFRHFGTSENHAARIQPEGLGNSKATQVGGDVLPYSTACAKRVKPLLLALTHCRRLLLLDRVERRLGIRESRRQSQRLAVHGRSFLFMRFGGEDFA